MAEGDAGKRCKRYGKHQPVRGINQTTCSLEQNGQNSEHETLSKDAEGPLTKTPVRVTIRGGDAHRRFRYVAGLSTFMNRVSTIPKLQALLHDIPTISDPLRDVYGLSIYADHDQTILVFPNQHGNRVTVPLDDFEQATSGAVFEWKDQVIRDGGHHGTDEAKMPEIHVILKTGRIMGKAADLYEVDVVNGEAIRDLEAKVAQLERENGDLKSEVLGLQLVREDLDAAAGIGGRLRKRKKSVRFAE